MTSRRFRTVQGAYRRPETGLELTHRLLRLPAHVFVGLAYLNTRGRGAGRTKWDLAALAVLAWYWKASHGHASTWTTDNGLEVEVAEDEMVLSVGTVARALWLRFVRRPVPAAEYDDREFKAHYEVVRQAVHRLTNTVIGGAPVIKCLGPVLEGDDLHGQRWTMAGSIVDVHLDTLLDAAPQRVLIEGDSEAVYEQAHARAHTSHLSLSYRRTLARYRGTLRCSSIQTDASGTMYVQEGRVRRSRNADVAQTFDVLIARDRDVIGTMTEAITKIDALAYREQSARSHEWQQRQARGHGGVAHVSIGAWAHGCATRDDRRDLTCATPFWVLDLDTDGPESGLDYAVLVVGRLADLGVRPCDLVVSYTGGRGFHVRVPHGAFGRPLWPRASDVASVLRRLAEAVLEGVEGAEGPAFDVVDTSLFSPMHLVRAVGSEREDAPHRRCVAYGGDVLLELVGGLGRNETLGLIEQNSEDYPPFTLANPARARRAEPLVTLLRSATKVERVRAAVRPEGPVQNRGIIARIVEGVAPGEEFAPGYVGRNKAAFLLALYYLTNGGCSEAETRVALETWNASCPVPLGTHTGDEAAELEGCLQSAVVRSRRPYVR